MPSMRSRFVASRSLGRRGPPLGGGQLMDDVCRRGGADWVNQPVTVQRIRDRDKDAPRPADRLA